MTRIRRLFRWLDNLSSRVRDRIPAGLRHAGRWPTSLGNKRPRGWALSRRSAIYVAAGMTLAGVAGVTVAAGVSGHPASRAGTRNVVNRAGQPRTPEASTSTAKRGGRQTGQDHLPARDRLLPVGTSGPQAQMPINRARYDNAKTIVRQAIDKHMGLRSAVIAIATAMQESTLLNLPNGTSDSVGLFQQRPSAGWGTARQIRQPAYATSAFLGALRRYQAQDPGWARQPLWQTAQGVQRSAFPSAYAKWEAQAAKLVAAIATSRA